MRGGAGNQQALAFVFARVGLDAKIVVTAQIDFVIGRLFGVLVDDVQIDIVFSTKIGIVGGGLFRRVERQRLLRLEHRFGRPLVVALDALGGIFLPQIIEPRAALGASALGAPFRLDHWSFTLRKYVSGGAEPRKARALAMP